VDLFPPNAIITQIQSDLRRTISFSDDAAQAAARLQKLILMYTSSTWAASLSVILEHQRNDERIFNPTLTQIARALACQEDLPSLPLYLRNLDQSLIITHEPLPEPTDPSSAAQLDHIVTAIARETLTEQDTATLRSLFFESRNSLTRGETGVLLTIAYLRSDDI